MKVIITLLILSHALISHTSTQIILSTKLQGTPVLVTKDDKNITFQTRDLKNSMMLEKCSEANYQFFVKKIERLSNQAVSIKTKDALLVETLGKSKTISPQSEFGKYLSNISQHLITLKNEMAIACKNK